MAGPIYAAGRSGSLSVGDLDLPYLGRKCRPEIWEPVPEWPLHEIPATVICNELKVDEQNTLSFWSATEGVNGADNIALAFASNLKSFPESLCIVLVPEEDLREEDVLFEASPGITSVADMKDRHLNAIRVTPDRMAAIARYMANGVRSGQTVTLYSRQQVIDLLCEAVRVNRLQLNDLKPDVQRAVRAEM